MATTEEIVAKYRLDLDELKTQVTELQSQFKKVDDGAQKAGKGIDNSFGKLGDQLKKLGTAVVAAFAADKIISFAKESVQAFAEAEQGALKLQAAVAGSGGLVSDFELLNNQAEDLAAITIFDDDTIKAAQTLALQFGLNSQAVAELIPKVADFAAATGQDLQGALQGVIGGINGQEKALKAYGITLDGTTNRNERLATITQQLTDKFNGQAEALTNTVGGSIGQAQKAYDELQEAIGQSLAPLVTDLSKSLTSIFQAFQAPPIEGLRQEQEELQATTLEVYGLQVGTEARTTAIKKLQEQYPDYLGNLDAEKVSNDELRKALEKVNNELTFKIAQQQLETELQPLREKAATSALAEADARRELAKQLNDVYQRTLSYNSEKNNQAVKDLQNLDIAEQAYLLQQGAVKLYGISTVSLVGVSDAYEQVKKSSGEYAAAQVEVNDKVKQARQRTEELRKTLGIPLEAKVTVKTTGLEGLTEEERKAAEERRKQREKETAEQLKALQQAATEEAKTTEQLRADELKTSQEYLDLYLADQVAAIQQRYQAERNAAQAEAQRQQADLVRQLEQGLLTREDYEKQKAAILAGIPNTEGQQALETLQVEASVLRARLNNLQDYTVDRKKLIEQAADLETTLEAARQAQDPAGRARLEREQAALQERLALIQFEADERVRIQEELARKESELATATDPVAVTNLEAERQALQERLALLTTDASQRLALERELALKTRALQLAGDPAQLAQLEQDRRVLEERLKLVEEGSTERAKLEQELASKTAAIDAQRTKNEQDQSALRVTNAERETQDKLDQLAREAQARREFNKTLQDLSGELANQVLAFTTQEAEQRTQALQTEKDERLAYFDEQQAALEEQYQKRLIGAQEFETASQQIAQQKIATEKSIDTQIKEIRRKQDAAKKAQSLYSIVVDTAAAIQAQLKTTPLPAGAPLVALIAASGLAQAGIVLSQKPPQYAEGVDYVPLGKNKKGRDTIPALLDEGERVISRKKNLKHWELYTAIDQDRLPQFIFQTYTLPVLQRERDRSREVFHQLHAAVQRQTETFTLAPTTTTTTADSGELRRLWRRGLSINNLDELAEVLDRRQPSPYRA